MQNIVEHACWQPNHSGLMLTACNAYIVLGAKVPQRQSKMLPKHGMKLAHLASLKGLEHEINVRAGRFNTFFFAL